MTSSHILCSLDNLHIQTNAVSVETLRFNASTASPEPILSLRMHHFIPSTIFDFEYSMLSLITIDISLNLVIEIVRFSVYRTGGIIFVHKLVNNTPINQQKTKTQYTATGKYKLKLNTPHQSNLEEYLKQTAKPKYTMNI